ncbi:MAG: ArsR/SmtB family transcription factor [Desulfonatronovibrionaceae bacterium]
MLDSDKAAGVFKVLSVPTRVRLVELLKNNSLCVNALACNLGITPAAVSQHLRILRDAGLVVGEKRGYFVHYRVSKKALQELSVTLKPLLNPNEKLEEIKLCANPTAAKNRKT